MAIPLSKTRPIGRPYLTVTDGSFTWKVLKAYSAAPDARFARWFCAVESPYTFGGYDLGDTYLQDIRGIVIQRDPDVPDSALPAWLR